MSAFQLVVLGDFAGRAESPLAARKLIAVDRDSFDDVLARIGARVDPDLPFCRSLEIRTWDDFSPDGLVARVPELSRLLEARGEVADPERMRALLDDAGVALEAQGEAPDTTSAAPPAPFAVMPVVGRGTLPLYQEPIVFWQPDSPPETTQAMKPIIHAPSQKGTTWDLSPSST